MVGDLNRAKINYSRYASASSEVFFNIPVAKRAKIR